MEKQLITFIMNHWQLWLAFFGVLFLMVVNEYLVKKQGPKHLSPSAAVDAINREKAAIVDMRNTEAFRQSHIVEAKNIPNAPLDKLEKYKTKPFILVCDRGLQSPPLAVKLRKQGFDQVMVLTGGIAAWKAASLPLIKGKKEAKKASKNKK